MIQLNTQPPAKQELRPDGLLDVHSVFLTMQGEGPFAGTPAVFVRLALCNLQCPGCDTEYTQNRQIVTPGDLCNWTNQWKGYRKPQMVVITGGEPFRQDIAEFVRRLKVWYGDDFLVQIETNGTLALDDFPYPAVTLVCSPKTPRIDARLVPWIKHLKYVIQADHIDPQDGLPTSVLGNGLRPARPWPGFLGRGTVWVQPADEQDPDKNRENVRVAIEVCLTYGYRMAVQTHKILGLE